MTALKFNSVILFNKGIFEVIMWYFSVGAFRLHGKV